VFVKREEGRVTQRVCEKRLVCGGGGQWALKRTAAGLPQWGMDTAS
jgi:hypothetical protein